MTENQRHFDEIFQAFAVENYPKLLALAQSLIADFPQCVLGYKAAGVALLKLKQKEAALPFMEKAATLDPMDDEALSNYAQTLLEIGNAADFAKAESILRQALKLNPESPVILNNLAGALLRQNKLDEAEIFAERAFLKDSDNVEIWKNRILAKFDSGKMAAGQELAEKALEKFPNVFEFQSHAFAYRSYFSDKIADFLPYLKRFSAFISTRYPPIFEHLPPKRAKKRLKIGFVSGDFNQHVVALFLENLLSALQNQTLDCYAYATSNVVDSTTNRLHPFFRRWQNIAAMDDLSAANLIKNDGIDILIDLSGHTKGNRLLVFALKPAPIQITWIGWNGTSGIPTMDYIFADSVMVPNEQSKAQFSETPFLTKGTWALYSPPKNLPEIADLPSYKNGFITFGAFHNPHKVWVKKTLELWGKCLKENPTARLLWMRPDLKNPQLKAFYLKEMCKLGIESERLDFLANENRNEYLKAHNQVDFILDTFPVSSGTTAMEALLMGVPSLTLKGELMASTLCASYLWHFDLKEWIATNPNEYIEKATFFAKDFLSAAQKHNARRHALRSKILQNPNSNAENFAAHFAQNLWQMWQKFAENSAKN